MVIIPCGIGARCWVWAGGAGAREWGGGGAEGGGGGGSRHVSELDDEAIEEHGYAHVAESHGVAQHHSPKGSSNEAEVPNANLSADHIPTDVVMNSNVLLASVACRTTPNVGRSSEADTLGN